MTPDIVDALKQGGLVLTVNRRLARHTQQQFTATQLAQGIAAWETPQVLSWNDWLSTLWDARGEEWPQALLAPHQLKALWDDVVKQSESGALILNPANTANQAAKAYDLLKQWMLDLEVLADVEHLDVQAFYHWASDYQSRCQQHGWLDSHGQIQCLLERMSQGCFQSPRQIVWVGFDSLTPQQRAVMDVQRQLGCEVSEAVMATQSSQAKRRPCSDVMAELETAAAWVYQLLEQNNDARIGIVIPDLVGLKNDVTRIFDGALCPEAALKLSDDFTRPYNLSYGQPLAEVPIIATALQLLSLVKSPMELPALGRLIQSPYLGGAESELGARALLDRRLRELGDARYSLKSMVRLTTGERARCDQLGAYFSALLAQQQSLPRRQLPSAWEAFFQLLLRASGWPGERTPNSPEFQAIEVWRSFLNQFASLDIIVGLISFSDAVSHLRQMAADHSFQLKTPETRVQILGLLEAAGLDFDHLWIMGLSDENWPAAPKPNPFLPARLQRQEEMPHASAERELHFAQELTQRLLGSAKVIVVSHPLRDGDRDLRPSPLIAGLEEDCSAIAPIENYRNKIYRSRTMETIVDWQATPLVAGTKVTGGSGVFTDQAACPFRAFAYRRLGARPLPELVSGLSPAQRGSILHRVLEQFWLGIKGQAELLRFEASALQERVSEVVNNVLIEEKKRQPLCFTERFTALEHDRLSQLLMVWLDVERKREAFTLISSEEKRTVQLGGLEVDIKADRIDRLDSDGREMIVDYKTSDRKTKVWFGERPDEPQLPLYAVTHNRPVAALTFAKLRPDGCGLEGVSDEVEVGRGVTGLNQQKNADVDDWSVQMERWRGVLETLANDFRNGNAEVDPKDLNTSCSYCGLEGLCRINENWSLD